MGSTQHTLVILTPAFALNADDRWLPFQGSFIRTLNRMYPALRVVVLAFHFPCLPAKRSRWLGNEVVTFSGGLAGGLQSPLRWARVWRELDRIRRAGPIAGILSMFCSESAFVGHYFARMHRLTHRIWVLGQDARATNPQVRRIRPHPGELVVISDFLRRQFQESHGIRPAHLVPIGILPDDFPPAGSSRPVHLLGAGSLNTIKRFGIFIDIAAQIRDSLPGLNAVICGAGPEEDRLRAQIGRQGLAGNLELKRHLDRSELLGVMQQSRILLHPSEYEGFGLVCTEALYAGAQVISFVRPMDREIKGWHIARDPDDMAAIARRLLLDDTLMHQRSLPFSMDETAASIMGLFGYREA